MYKKQPRSLELVGLESGEPAVNLRRTLTVSRRLCLLVLVVLGPRRPAIFFGARNWQYTYFVITTLRMVW